MTAPLRLPFESGGDVRRMAPSVADHLRRGGVIVYPTETVYGFGCALRPEALARLADLKSRDEAKPFLLLAADPTSLEGLVWGRAAERLARAFWPGPLTLALPARPGAFPAGVVSAYGTVAVRSSPHPAVRAILDALGEPITSTSANVPGGAPADTGEAAWRTALEVGAGAELWVLDGGALPPSAPSTLVDCSGERPRIVRAGALPPELIRGVVPEVQLDG